MLVQVTAEDIRRGKRCVSYACPIALAIKRKKPEAKMISVGCVSVYIQYDDVNHNEEYFLSKRGKEFISDFDASLPVKPINLRLFKE